jgi:hypothetical protein
MSTLQEQLERVIQRHGADSASAQMLQDQIAAQQTGKSAQELYITGSVKNVEADENEKG